MHLQDDLFNASSSYPIDFCDLVTHIPVGVCRFLLDEEFTMTYGNRALLDLIGYTRAQFYRELEGHILRTFLPNEQQMLRQRMLGSYRSGSSAFRLEHRILRRDGQIIWILVSGNFLPDLYGQAPTAYGVVVDITDRKQMEERLRIDEERFRLALAQTDNTIFDYDIATRTMIHADRSAGRYGLSHVTHDVPDVLVREGIVHPDSATEFLEMYRQISSGAPMASCVIRAKTVDGRFLWNRITMTNIFDRDGNAVRAVGMLEDIDAQRCREARLLERSQQDALTGLYNKGITESLLRTLLSGSQPCGALFIIDLDSFKLVNDRYGHLFGDLLLADSARRIGRLCRQEDLIGRIGGDEFLVYLNGELTGDRALRKAQEICEAFRPPFCFQGVTAHCSCTVGVALCPKDGTTFELLYQKADVALYEAKRIGKDRCLLYGPNMDSALEWVPYSSTQIDVPVSPSCLAPDLQ